MSSFAEAWAEAGKPQDDFDPPDGDYFAILVDGGAFTGRTDGKDYVKLKWQIDKGDHVGRQFEDFQGITHPVGLRITREKLVLLGLDADGIEDVDDLGRAIFDLINVKADITVGHKNGFRTVTVRRVLTDESDVPAPKGEFARTFASAAGQTSDEDIPF